MGLLKVGSAPKVWVGVEGIEPFEVEVQYLSPSKIKEITTNATTRALDKNTRQMVDKLDNDKFAQLMVRAMVTNWRGLTVDALKKLMPVDDSSVEAIEAAGGELAFSLDDLTVLAENTYSKSFMDKVMEVATDLELIRRAEAVALGNA